MAEKKSSGFKTFLLMVIVIVLAIFFGLCAYLMLVPNSKLFGLRYMSNGKTISITRVDDQLLKLSNYSKIVVNAGNGTGHTKVSVNASRSTSMAASKIFLYEGTKGFAHYNEDAQTEYTLDAVANNGVLTINVTEPKYDFLQLANNTLLSIDLYSPNDSLSGVTVEINTGADVTIGGLIKSTDVGDNLEIGNVNVNTQGGTIKFLSRAQVLSDANLITKSGAINLAGEKNSASIYLESNTGKITTEKIVAKVSVKTFNSRVSLGNIVGNVELDMESGILDLQDIEGNLHAENKIKYTSVNAGTISGTTTLKNNDGNFQVNIKKCVGPTTIQTKNKTVNLEQVCDTCRVITEGGQVNIKKDSTNTKDLIVETQGGGVNIKFYDFEKNKIGAAMGVNTVKTKNGGITMTFGVEAHFILNANSNDGKVIRDWLMKPDSETKPVENYPVGDNPPTTNQFNLESEKGNITIKRS